MEITEKDNKRSFGKLGEELAAKYLEESGYNIITTNYRVGTLGELDIIASEKEFICFIEVKTRTSSIYGAPCEAVGKRKQQIIKKLAWAYLKKHNKTNAYIRFDIVEVYGKTNNGEFHLNNINVIKNAF